MGRRDRAFGVEGIHKTSIPHVSSTKETSPETEAKYS